jgi:hypothetical protein
MVHAVKVANGQKGTFSQEAWDNLTPDKNGLRDGWKQVEPEPPSEVSAKIKGGKSTEKEDKL